MAETKKYLHNLDVSNNKVINLLLNPLTTSERTSLSLGPLDQGYVCYDTDLNQQYFWDGNAWMTAGGNDLQQVTDIGYETTHPIWLQKGTSNTYPLSAGNPQISSLSIGHLVGDVNIPNIILATNGDSGYLQFGRSNSNNQFVFQSVDNQEDYFYFNRYTNENSFFITSNGNFLGDVGLVVDKQNSTSWLQLWNNGISDPVRLKADNATQNRDILLPDADATLAVSVNGNYADSTGEITLTIPSNYITSVSNTPTINLSVSSGDLTADFASLNISQFTNDSGYIIDLSAFTTDNLSEGANNFYDKTVSLTAGTGISVSGTYPNFTIDNASPFTSPLTTKGDIFVRNGSGDTRLPVGLDTQVLIADSTQTTGMKWGSNTAPTQLGYYGAWQDDVTQTAAASNTGYAMIFRTADVTPNGISIASNGTNLTRITFANTGIYNIQFSSQFQNLSNAPQDVTIWLRKNGTDVPGSAGVVGLEARKNPGDPYHIVAGWNYVLSVVGGDYYELVWSTTDHTNVEMRYYAAGNPPPSAASVILTVTQQSGIMAGTGLTALNGLTGAVQTFSNDTNVTITSAGTTHTLGWSGTLADGRIASATNWNTAYTNRITSLTTTGSSGAATLSSNTLNIPNYTADGILPSQTGNSGKYLTTNGTTASWGTISVPTGANPSATIGLTAVNGSASTFMRSDGAPALDQTIAPTWTGKHIFNPTLTSTGNATSLNITTSGAVAAGTIVSAIYSNITDGFTGGNTRHLRGLDINMPNAQLVFTNNGSPTTPSTASTVPSLFINRTGSSGNSYIAFATTGSLNAGMRFNTGGNIDIGAFISGGYYPTFWSNNAEVGRFTATNGNLLIGTTTDAASTDKVQANGNLNLITAGNKIKIATGTNASIGTSGAIAAGTVTVSTTAVTANSKIFLSRASAAGTLGLLSVGTITAGSSFTITSSNTLDTSTVNWWIIN